MKAAPFHPGLAIALKLAITAAILAILSLRFDLGAALRLLPQLTGSLIIGTLALLAIQALLTGGRLVLILASVGHPVDYWFAFRVTLQSMFFNQTFVSVLGGDAYRIWRLQQSGMALPRASGAVVFDRAFGFAINHLLFIAALPFLWGMIDDLALKLLLAGLAGGGLAVIVGAIVAAIVIDPAWLTRYVPERWHGLARGLDRLIEAFKDLIRYGRGSLALLAISIAISAINAAAFLLILLQLGVRFELAAAGALMVPAIVTLALLPVSLAGWGVREAAAVVLFGALGVAAPVALAASIAYGTLVLVIGLAGGVCFLAEQRR